MSTEECNISTTYQNDNLLSHVTLQSTISHYSPRLYILFPFFKIKNYHCFILKFLSCHPHCNILIFQDEAVLSFWMNHFLHGLLLPVLFLSCSISKTQIFSHRSFCFLLSYPQLSFFLSSPTVFLFLLHVSWLRRFAYTL